MLISGEAGSGKTSLVAEVVRHAAGPPRVHRGACDPLATPRPLGPLIDALLPIDREAALQVANGMSRAEAFAIALGLLDGTFASFPASGSQASPRPAASTVFVVEDAHWADDATLDLLSFLGRRITTIPAVLVITYRDDELGGDHPLRSRIGEFGSAARLRLHLAALSVEAVQRLTAGTLHDPASLHASTAGNPFFVSEILAAADTELPETVRDAVLARAGRLSRSARATLDAASIVPGDAERWLIEAIAAEPGSLADVDECVERGLLLERTGNVAFRHELARRAVTDAISARRRRDLHQRAVDALLEPPDAQPDPTRLSFHAAEAGDARTLARFGPAAAARAIALGAHREAIAHLERVLRSPAHLTPRERAEVLVRSSDEHDLVGAPEQALAAADEAAGLFADIGDVERRAEVVLRTARPLTNLGRLVEADARREAARTLVGAHPSPRFRAAMAAYECSAAMLARHFEEAEETGQEAIALGTHLGDHDLVAEVSIQSGIALAMAGQDEGLARIRRGIDLAMAHGNDRLAALGHLQIGSGYGEMRRYDVAVPALVTGRQFTSDRELVSSLHYVTAWLARCRMELGEWQEATDLAGGLVRNPRCVGVNRFVALTTLGWLRGRRGDPDVQPLLDEALELARSTGHIQRLWPVAACRAEIAWIRGELDREVGLVEEALALARALDYRRAVEELEHWRVAAGATAGSIGRPFLTPFGLSASRRFDLAAAAWARAGCPFESAFAQLLAGDGASLRAAHRSFDALGAAPLRARAAASMRALGVAVPRGPVASTRSRPLGLTNREIGVLALLVDGQTDREIAAELHISIKTAGHHVSNILAKLQVRSRGEAALKADRLGLLTG